MGFSCFENGVLKCEITRKAARTIRPVQAVCSLYQVSQASGLDKISQRVYSRVSSGGNQSFALNGAAGSAMMPKLAKQLDDLQKQPWRK